MPSRQGQLDKNKLRNLTPFRNKTDEEFDEWFSRKVTGVAADEVFEKRIQDKIDEFGKDYDLSDLKANDMMMLRALAQKLIFLDDLEQASYLIRVGGLVEIGKDSVSLNKLTELKTINDSISSTTKDILSLQENLNISRKSRKNDKETSVINELERLKKAASEFIEQRLFYVFCPKCNELLATVWFLYPDEPRNKLRLRCIRKPDGENICGTTLLVGSKELLEKRGVNIENVPDYFK